MQNPKILNLLIQILIIPIFILFCDFIFELFIDLQLQIQQLFFTSPLALSKLPKNNNTNCNKRKALTNAERAAIELTREQIDVIVGCGLGYLYLKKDSRSLNGNARLRFAQGKLHESYLLDLFKKFKNLTPQNKLKESAHFIKSTNNYYTTLYF